MEEENRQTSARWTREEERRNDSQKRKEETGKENQKKEGDLKMEGRRNNNDENSYYQEGLRKRTKDRIVCKYFLEDRCDFGEDCRFSHQLDNREHERNGRRKDLYNELPRGYEKMCDERNFRKNYTNNMGRNDDKTKDLETRAEETRRQLSFLEETLKQRKKFPRNM